MYGYRRVRPHLLQGPAFSCLPSRVAAARRRRSRVLRSRRSMTRVPTSSLRAAVHAACTAHDDAVEEEEHSQRKEDVDPAWSGHRESDERPNRKQYDRKNYPEIHARFVDLECDDQ